jgi:hypothetical protein
MPQQSVVLPPELAEPATASQPLLTEEEVRTKRDTGAAVRLAWRAFRAENLERATEWFTLVQSWEPDHADAALGLGYIAARRGQWAEAERLARLHAADLRHFARCLGQTLAHVPVRSKRQVATSRRSSSWRNSRRTARSLARSPSRGDGRSSGSAGTRLPGSCSRAFIVSGRMSRPLKGFTTRRRRPRAGPRQKQWPANSAARSQHWCWISPHQLPSWPMRASAFCSRHHSLRAPS